jgi:hypothetical protein
MPELGSQVTDLAFSSNIGGALDIYALDMRGRIRRRWRWRDAVGPDQARPLGVQPGQGIIPARELRGHRRTCRRS